MGRAIPAPDEKNNAESLDVRYARAQLRLAETNLRKVELTNERFAKTLSAAVISEYQEDLVIAKAQLQNTLQGGELDQYTTWVRAAESNWKSAEANYKNASSANQKQPGSVGGIDLDRIRLRVEITRLQFERGKALASAPMDKKLQWQISVLNDEVARLKIQTSRIAPQTRVYPWRY